MLGLQHAVVVAPNLAIIVLVARATGASADAIASLISCSLLALAATTCLQSSLRTGSGFFIVSCTSGIYVSASLAAAVGGLPLVSGMTLLAGLVQVLFAQALVRLRRFFPNELIAVSVMVVGLELGAIGLQRISTSGNLGLVVGALTFLVSVTLGVYGRGSLKLYCALLGVVFGYFASVFAGLAAPEFLSEALSGPVFGMPSPPDFRFDFRGEYLLPFAFAAVAASLKTMGAVVISDQMNDTAWVRPNIRLVRKAVSVDGLGTALSGLLGGFGTNSNTASIGVARATGATSRSIGYSVAAWMVLFAFSPAFVHLFVAMPDAVIGGTLLFVACMVTVNGLQLLGTVTMDMRRSAVLAFPLILAMAKIGNAPPFNLVPESLKPYFASALAIAVIAALLTNALYTLGVTRRATLVFEPSITPLERLALVRKILDDWKVAQNVKARATLTLRELLDENASSIRLRFNGCTLDFALTRNAAGEPNDHSPAESRFFSERVCDGVSRRKGPNASEVFSAYYEQ